MKIWMNTTVRISLILVNMQDAMVTNNFSNPEPAEMVTLFSDKQKFVTLETPREKISDLEKNEREDSKFLPNKMKKSVTFDLRNRPEQVEEESPEQSYSSDDEDHLPEEFKNNNDHGKFKAENNILVEEAEKSTLSKIFSHMACSSLFIFHRDWKFRKFLIDLVVSPETQTEYDNRKMEDAMFNSYPENKNDDMNKVILLLLPIDI